MTKLKYMLSGKEIIFRRERAKSIKNSIELLILLLHINLFGIYTQILLKITRKIIKCITFIQRKQKNNHFVASDVLAPRLVTMWIFRNDSIP
jgi:hypothetical protein